MMSVDYEFLEKYVKTSKWKALNRFEALNCQKRSMFTLYEYAVEKQDNDVTCELLEDDLNIYCGNFKDLINSNEELGCFARDDLTTARKNAKSLRSSLNDNLPTLSEKLTNLKGDCSGSNEKLCALKVDPKPTNSDWNQFKNSFVDLPRKANSVRELGPLTEQPIFQQDNSFRSNVPLFYRRVDAPGQSKDRPSNPTGLTRTVTVGDGKYTKRVGGWRKNWGSNRNSNETSGDEALDKDEPMKSSDGQQQAFKTAGQQLKINENKQNRNGDSSTKYQPLAPMKSLGGKRGVRGKFVPPMKNDSQEENAEKYRGSGGETSNNDEDDPRLKHIPRNMVELIRSEIMDNGAALTWNDIAGLDLAKSIIKEIIVWPMLRPDIFTGLRRPPKGILLFGPPGTGKTLIGKCIASQSNSTFFSISASSLTSKWIGDGEKMVRALFAVARVQQPSVIFIDEIDSLLSQRRDSEHDSTRKMKTEFLIQLDGAATSEDDKILIIGATNRPQELDEAARRRLVKRLYIPLPDLDARIQLVTNLMKNERSDLTFEHITEIAEHTDGFSGADVKNLCQEASLGPIRSIEPSMMSNISADQVRPVCLTDFINALKRVRSSVSSGDLEQYVTWDKTYGMGSAGMN